MNKVGFSRAKWIFFFGPFDILKPKEFVKKVAIINKT